MAMSRCPKLILTCEHAVHHVPARYKVVRERAGMVLMTHRGYDPGTLELGRYLRRRLGVPLVVGACSRLLVELNRSLHHRALWSEFSRDLPPSVKEEILGRYYHPYRRTVEDLIRRGIGAGRRVVHVSLHSFTPIWEGEERRVEVGLLFDPSRDGEATFCRRWQEALHRMDAGLRVRRNFPYRGVADGLTKYLRSRFADPDYVGVELEVNQRLPMGAGSGWRRLKRLVEDSLVASLQ